MSRDDVTVTPEEMAQAIENAQTAVFRDPPWSPNARAFLALLADRDALRAELERTKEDLGRVRRNHLRRTADSIWEAFERIAPMTDERQDDALRKLTRLRDRCRAALERNDGA